MSDEFADTLLHEKLQEGALEVTPSTEETKAQLQAMIARAELEAQVKPRRLGLIISGSLVAALLLGGATIPGVINVFRQSSPVQLPLLEYSYKLPSGAECAATYGVFADADADAVETIRRNTTVSQLVDEGDIDAVIAEMRADPVTFVTETGAREPGGYGSKYYSGADSEYLDAFRQAIRDQLQVELIREGFPADALGVNSWGEDSCPGAAW